MRFHLPSLTPEPPAGEPHVTQSARRRRAPRPSFPGERPVTPEVVREHNLNELEYGRIVELLGRTPTLTELGVFSALWSEHCSYKHSKPVLKTFPTTGPHVVQGPGENAGVLRLPRRLGGGVQDRVAQPPVGGRALSGRRDRGRRHPARRLHHGRAPGGGAQQPAVRPARPPAQPLPLRRRGARRGRLRQLRRRADARRRGRLRPGLHRQSAGQRDVRRPAPGGAT